MEGCSLQYRSLTHALLIFKSLLPSHSSLHWSGKSVSSSLSQTSALPFLVQGVRRKSQQGLNALKWGICISKGQEQTRNKIGLCQRFLMKMSHRFGSAGAKYFSKLKIQGLAITASGLYGVFRRIDWHAMHLYCKALINENYRVGKKWYHLN